MLKINWPFLIVWSLIRVCVCGRPECVCGLLIGTAGSQAVGDNRTEAFPPRRTERFGGEDGWSTRRVETQRIFPIAGTKERRTSRLETKLPCVRRGLACCRAYCFQFQTLYLLRGLFFFFFFLILGPLACCTYMVPSKKQNVYVYGLGLWLWDFTGVARQARILCVGRKIIRGTYRY